MKQIKIIIIILVLSSSITSCIFYHPIVEKDIEIYNPPFIINGYGSSDISIILTLKNDEDLLLVNNLKGGRQWMESKRSIGSNDVYGFKVIIDGKIIAKYDHDYIAKQIKSKKWSADFWLFNEKGCFLLTEMERQEYYKNNENWYKNKQTQEK